MTKLRLGNLHLTDAPESGPKISRNYPEITLKWSFFLSVMSFPYALCVHSLSILMAWYWAQRPWVPKIRKIRPIKYDIDYLDSRRLYCRTPEKWFGGESRSYGPKVGDTAGQTPRIRTESPRKGPRMGLRCFYRNPPLKPSWIHLRYRHSNTKWAPNMNIKNG